ncbi:MAG: hypothetical protein LBG44_08550 [Gemmatimonadota bacterium]|jgi:hypothetical protein|nr:hypothetical protein [Gemmatimonadota bacterium]
MDWSPDNLDSLERAIVDGCRVQLTRRGTEYVVLPTTIRSSGFVDELIAVTSTGDRLSFPLPEIDAFSVFD